MTNNTAPRDASILIRLYYITRQVIKVRALVLEPIDPGSILDGEFLEGHDFASQSWKIQDQRFELE